MAGKKHNPDGPNAEERALERFTELMIKKISSIKGDWKKPWFTENFMAWPKNLSGREYNGMNALMLMLLCEENSYKLPVFCTFQRVSGLNYSTDRQGNHKPLTDANGERLPQVSVLKGEKSFPVFPRLVLVKIRGDGDLYPCHDQWVRGMGGLDRTLQRLRAYRL